MLYYSDVFLSDEAEFGTLALLTNHACSSAGDTSGCCQVFPEKGICGLYYDDEFLHPCDGCGAVAPPEDPNVLPTDDPNEQENPVTPDDPSVYGNCSTCTMYYHTDDLSTPPLQRGDLAPLTSHACGYFSGDTSECCKLSPEQGICGVFWENEFLSPCSGCQGIEDEQSGAPSTVPTSIPSATPTFGPTEKLSDNPSSSPNELPSTSPSVVPVLVPSEGQSFFLPIESASPSAEEFQTSSGQAFSQIAVFLLPSGFLLFAAL